MTYTEETYTEETWRAEFISLIRRIQDIIKQNNSKQKGVRKENKIEQKERRTQEDIRNEQQTIGSSFFPNLLETWFNNLSNWEIYKKEISIRFLEDEIEYVGKLEESMSVEMFQTFLFAYKSFILKPHDVIQEEEEEEDISFLL